VLDVELRRMSIHQFLDDGAQVFDGLNELEVLRLFYEGSFRG